MQNSEDVPENVAGASLQAETLFERLPPWVVDTLTTEQKEAIHTAITEPAWKAHSVNLRMSVPVLGRHYYVTAVAGEERRSAERRSHESRRYPVRTLANIFFVVGIAALFYALALIAVALHSAVIKV